MNLKRCSGFCDLPKLMALRDQRRRREIYQTLTGEVTLESPLWWQPLHICQKYAARSTHTAGHLTVGISLNCITWRRGGGVGFRFGHRLCRYFVRGEWREQVWTAWAKKQQLFYMKTFWLQAAVWVSCKLTSAFSLLTTDHIRCYLKKIRRTH